MEGLSPNPVLTFNENQMAEVRIIFGYDDLNRLLQDIRLLEDWIKKQEHFLVKDYDKEYLERHLISSKGSIERAKKRLDKLCTLRGIMPEYLQGFDTEKEFKDVLKVSYVCLSPKPTPDNYRILIHTVHTPDGPELYSTLGVGRYMLMCVEYLFCHDYSAGIALVVDTKNFNLAVVKHLNPVVISNTLMLIAEALGLRLKGLHFISGSKVIDTFMAIIRQAMPKKLAPRLHVHDNVESLLNFFPKETLPKDFGGDLKSLQEITEKQFKEFSTPDFKKKLKFIENAITDESKRVVSRYNQEHGMAGAFKNLSVD